LFSSNPFFGKDSDMSYLLFPSDEKKLEEGGYGQQIRGLLADCLDLEPGAIAAVINGGEIVGIACNAGVELATVRAFAWRVVNDQRAAQPVF